MQAQLAFYSPKPEGRITGGFLYNQRLLEKLASLGVSSDLVTRGGVEHQASLHIVDSLLAVDYMKTRAQPNRALFLYHLPPYAGRSVPDNWLRVELRLIEQKKIVVTGTQCFELLMARHRIPEVKLKKLITIIKPGIADNWQVKTEFAPLPQELLVLASVIPQKGIESIVDVLAELTELSWGCSVYGETQQDPVFYQSMLRKIAKLGLENRIQFAGTIAPDKVNQVMRDADLLLNFSEFETYSMITAEAIATGLPMLSTPVGEMDEFKSASSMSYLQSHENSEKRQNLHALLTQSETYQALCHSKSQAKTYTESSNDNNWTSVAKQWLAVIVNMKADAMKKSHDDKEHGDSAEGVLS